MRPQDVAPSFTGLAVPAASSGDGILSVNSAPWGRVTVDGRYVCDSPCAVRLGAGRHHVALRNPESGASARHDVLVRAGTRTKLLSTLTRR